MQIKVARIYRKEDAIGYWKKGDVQEIEGHVINNHCCPDMAEYWGEFVAFGERDAMLNKNDKVNIYHCSPYPEGAVYDEAEIAFCPFCGEAIEYVEEGKGNAISDHQR